MPPPVRRRRSRRQLADIAAVADLFTTKALPSTSTVQMFEYGRLPAFATGCAASACGTGSTPPGCAVFEEFEADLREQRHGEHASSHGVSRKLNALLLRRASRPLPVQPVPA